MECLILICSLAAAPNAAIVRGRQCENQKIPSVVKNKDMYRKTGTQTFPSLPKAITSFGAVRIGDWLYAYGGHYGKPHHYSQAGQSDQLQRLHLKSKTKWEHVASGPKLQGLALVEYKGRLYRVGGLVASNKESEEQDLYSLSDFARFDASAGKWKQLPAMPEARSSFDAAILNDKLYVAGGWAMSGKGSDSTWCKSAYAVDLSKPPFKWQRLPDPPFQCRAVSVGAVNGKIIVIGGIQPDGKVTRKCAVFHPETGKWADAPTLPSGEMEGFGTACCTVGKRLFVSTISGRLLRLNEEEHEWQQVCKLREARFFHQMVAFPESSVILLGGANMETGKFSSVEIVDLDVADRRQTRPDGD